MDEKLSFRPLFSLGFMVVVANEFEKDATREGIVICFCDVSLRGFHFIQNEKENFVTRRRTKNSQVWCRGAKKSSILFHAYTCGFDQTIKLLFFVLSLSLSLSRFAMSILRLEGGGGGGQNVKFVEFVVVE